MDILINPRQVGRKSFGSYDRVKKGQGFFDIFSKVLPFIAKAAKNILFPAVKTLGKNIIQSDSAKKIAQDLAKQAKNAGMNAVSNIIKGKNIKKDLKKDFTSTKSGLANNLKNFSLTNNKNNNAKKRPAEKEAPRASKKAKKFVYQTKKKKRSRDLFSH
jgi:hypothetical protein